MDLLDAIAESRAVRSQEAYDVYITKDGVSYTPPPPPPGLLSKAGDVAMSAGEAVVDAAMDPVGTAKATGRAVAGGLRDFSQGVIDLSSELGGMIETNVGSLGYLNVDENGVNWSKEPPAGAQPGQLGDLPDVPKGDSMAEGFARGLVQFAAGMAAAPVRGAGMGANMLRSGFADALLDPEEGNLSSLLKGMGLDYAVLDYLDSKVDSDAGPEERLKARILQAVEGTAIGVPIDVVMYGFRLIRSNKEAVEAVKETLAQAPPPTDTQVMPSQSFFDKAGEATDRFVTQAATTTDEVATSAARATDEFVSKVEPSPDASYDGGKIAGDGKLSSTAQNAAMPTRKQFQKNYLVHVDVKGRQGKHNPQEVKESVLKNGFTGGQLLPAYKGGTPTNIIDEQYAPRKGDVIYVIPPDGYETRNGMEYIKKGYKPPPNFIIEAPEDFIDVYEVFSKSQAKRRAKG